MAHILVIDDDEMVRAMTKAALETGGHSVSTAADGREAARKVDQEKFDLLITDIIMPDRDGLEVITGLKGRARMPVIAMTGLFIDAALYLKIAQTLGADRTIQKPFTGQQLLHLVREVLQTKPAG